MRRRRFREELLAGAPKKNPPCGGPENQGLAVFADETYAPDGLSLSKWQVNAFSQARIFRLKVPDGNGPFAGSREDFVFPADSKTMDLLGIPA